jgi:hypothetical protein
MPAHRKNFDSAVAMYESGLSIEDVAIAHGRSRQAMYAALKRRGVEFRPRLRFGEDNHFFKDAPEYDARVRIIVSKAIARGRLIRKPCEICRDNSKQKDGRSAIQAHHDDYNKPLEVRWLCDPCHREWHRTHEPIRRIIDLLPMTPKEIAATGGKSSWAKHPKKSLSNLAIARTKRKHS